MIMIQTSSIRTLEFSVYDNGTESYWDEYGFYRADGPILILNGEESWVNRKNSDFPAEQHNPIGGSENED